MNGGLYENADSFSAYVQALEKWPNQSLRIGEITLFIFFTLI